MDFVYFVIIIGVILEHLFALGMWIFFFLLKDHNNEIHKADFIYLFLQVNETESEDTDLQIFCVSCSHPINPKVALRHMERCYAKVNTLFALIRLSDFIIRLNFELMPYKIMLDIY